MKQQTKKIIMLSFKNMLERMPFDKITVSALVRECEINHNTFYYYYHDIYQLLDEWIEWELDRSLSENGNRRLEDNLKKLLYKCRDNSKIIYHIFGSLSRDHLEQYLFTTTNGALYQQIYEKARDKKISDVNIQNITDFCRYALMGYFLRFLWNNMEEDIENEVDNIAHMLDIFIENSIEEFSKRQLS